jgi:hypothetical protein
MLDLLHEGRDVLVVEGETASEHSEENDAGGPDVGKRAGVGNALCVGKGRKRSGESERQFSK